MSTWRSIVSDSSPISRVMPMRCIDHQPAFAHMLNWAYTVRMPDEVTAPVDYLSGDFVWAFGMDSAALEAELMDSPWPAVGPHGIRYSPPAVRSSKAKWTTKSFAHLAIGGALSRCKLVAHPNLPTPVQRYVGLHMERIAELADSCVHARQFARALPPSRMSHCCTARVISTPTIIRRIPYRSITKADPFAHSLGH